jgi:ribosomal protein S10
MRLHSIFQESKLLSFASINNSKTAAYLKGDCNLKNGIYPNITEGRYCLKGSLNSRVQQLPDVSGTIPQRILNSKKLILVLSSFESKDLECALKIIHKFIIALTNQLNNLFSFLQVRCEKEKKSLLNPLTFTKGKYYSSVGKKNLQYFRCKIEMGGTTVPLPEADKILKNRTEKKPAVGVLRAVRAINQSFKPMSIPQSTQLYTVIKSPHVYKKTREQFATTLCKCSLIFDFNCMVDLRLLMDSLVMLKLPVEVKFILKNF